METRHIPPSLAGAAGADHMVPFDLTKVTVPHKNLVGDYLYCQVEKT